jgi:hypothetical protein
MSAPGQQSQQATGDLPVASGDENVHDRRLPAAHFALVLLEPKR